MGKMRFLGLAVAAAVSVCLAADTPKTATAAGKEVVLFDGSNLNAWTCKPDGWLIDEDGALALQPKGGYIWSRERFGDFELSLEFKLDKGTNSGIFIRTGSTRDAVQTGIEVQVLDSYGKAKVGRHDCGAIYDCVAPSSNMCRAPGEWNAMVIHCAGSRIRVQLNGEQVVDMDLDQWTTPNQNPDGSKNKFKTAYRDMPRDGHIGFQDHGKPVWYRNIVLRQLD